MTDEEHIGYYRRVRTEALAIIEEINVGRVERFEFEGHKRVNTTARWRAEKQHEVDCANRIIAAREKIVAQSIQRPNTVETVSTTPLKSRIETGLHLRA